MDEPWKNYLKWKKPDTNGNVLHDPFYMKMSRTGTAIETESRWKRKEKINREIFFFFCLEDKGLVEEGQGKVLYKKYYLLYAISVALRSFNCLRLKLRLKKLKINFMSRAYLRKDH